MTGRMDGKEDRRRRPPQQDKTTDIIMLEMGSAFGNFMEHFSLI
jgi:hypothetical protein